MYTTNTCECMYAYTERKGEGERGRERGRERGGEKGGERERERGRERGGGRERSVCVIDSTVIYVQVHVGERIAVNM